MQIYRKEPSKFDQIILSMRSDDDANRLIAFCAKVLEHDAQSPCAIEFDQDDRKLAKAIIHHVQELSRCGKVWALGPCPSPFGHEGDCPTKGGRDA